MHKCSARLSGLTWGVRDIDIAAAFGASTNRRPDGEYDTVYQMTGARCLTGASAAGGQPTETIWSDFGGEVGLIRDSITARQRGFTGKIATHLNQVATINAAFTPSADEMAWAHEVFVLFASNPSLGTVGLEGKMLDMLHLKQAQRILALAQRFKS